MSDTLYELDGGILTVNQDLRMRNSRLITFRGTVELGSHALLMDGKSCGVMVSGGTINANGLSFGPAESGEGFKIIRFEGGAGSINLTGDIRFHAEGSQNDFIDFSTGTRGRLVSRKDAGYFATLWDAGRLRIDGEAGVPGQFGDSGFQMIAINEGRVALVLSDG